MAEEALRQQDDGGDMGELPNQGFEWVMLENFGLERSIYFRRPSKYLMARKRDHQGPGVDGPAEDGL